VAIRQHPFNQLLQFLQQGISAIFHFVQMIWTCNGKHLLGLINDAVIALQLVLQLERVLCLPQ
jgi:phage-related protein